MPRLSRPALIISACIFICALLMLCVAQFSKARVIPADFGPQAVMTSVQAADAGGHTEASEAPVAEIALADLSSELSEPMLPVPAALLPGMRVAQPAAPVDVDLPHPLIEGPQRPPRVFLA